MAQPAQIAVEEGAQIIHSIFEHGEPVDAAAEGEALPFVGIEPAGGDDARVDHAGAQQLHPPVAATEDAAAVLYTDGRKLVDFVTAEAKAEKALTAKESAKCRAEWAAAPAAFDDLGVSLTMGQNDATLLAAWGNGASKFAWKPVDDGGIDARALSKEAMAVLSLYAASMAPFQALKRVGPFANAEKLLESSKRLAHGAPRAHVADGRTPARTPRSRRRRHDDVRNG